MNINNINTGITDKTEATVNHGSFLQVEYFLNFCIDFYHNCSIHPSTLPREEADGIPFVLYDFT